MKIIVTGGKGFIGSSITKKLLADGHEVHTIGRSSNSTARSSNDQSKYHTLDLSEKILPSALATGTDIIFHVAAKAGVWGKYSEFHNANVKATKNVIQACSAYNIPKLIYTSSPSVVFSGHPIRNGEESLPYGTTGMSAYATTKALAEKEILSANRVGKLQTIALRPHLVWGKGDPHLLPRVIKRHKSAKLRLVGNGNNQVDLTHIDNVAHAHVCAMEAVLKDENLGGKAYFIGQGEQVNLWNWLNQIFKLIELPLLSKKLSFKKAFFTGLLLEGIWRTLRISGEPPMTRFVACQLSHDHYFSVKSAEKDLGYRPIKNMNTALQETIPWLSSL